MPSRSGPSGGDLSLVPIPAGAEVSRTAEAALRPLRARRVRVERALNGHADLPHSQRRERARQALAEKRFLEGCNEMTLYPGWPRQCRLAWFKSHGRWTVCTLAAERNDQNGFDSFAQITGVERYDQDSMTRWRVPKHRGPDLAAPGRSVIAVQSPSLEMRRSRRLRDRPLPRRP